MSAGRMAGVVLLMAGIAALAYGGFSYTRVTHSADIGSLHLQVNEKTRVNVPVWAGVASMAAGLLLATARKP